MALVFPFPAGVKALQPLHALENGVWHPLIRRQPRHGAANV